MVAGRERRHAGADLDHDARALVSEDRREEPLGIGARERVGVGVTDAGRLDLDQHLAGARPVELDGLDGERLSGAWATAARIFIGSSSSSAHGRRRSSSVVASR